MVDSMKAGSVIVDLAAQNGGNCEYTVPGVVTTTANGVKVIGYTDLPGRLPTQSSQLYGTNFGQPAEAAVQRERRQRRH